MKKYYVFAYWEFQDWHEVHNFIVKTDDIKGYLTQKFDSKTLKENIDKAIEAKEKIQLFDVLSSLNLTIKEVNDAKYELLKEFVEEVKVRAV